MPLTALFLLSDAALAFDILGVSAIEFQMRRAVHAGARHIVVLVQRMPSALHAAADAVRHDGIGVDIARSITDALEFVHPDDRVLVMSPHTTVTGSALAALCAHEGPAVLTIDRGTGHPRLEIVDALAQWTGYALLDGSILRETAVAIGDWDVASVVLRSLVQRNARQIRIEATATIVAIDTAAGVRLLGRRLIATAPADAAGLGEFWLTAPVARWLARSAGERGARDIWTERVALLLGLIAPGLAFIGWIALATVVILLALIAASVAATLRHATASIARMPRAHRWLMRGSAAATVLLTGGILARETGQWGHIVLAFALIATMALVTSYHHAKAQRFKLADIDGLVVVVAVAAMFGMPGVGIALAMLAAAASVAAIRFAETKP